MSNFNRKHIIALEKYIHNTHFHDAIIEEIDYEPNQRILTCKIANNFFEEQISLAFLEVKSILFFCGNWYSNVVMPKASKTVYSLDSDTDCTLFQNSPNVYSENLSDFLHLTITLLSGDELHILFKELSIKCLDR